MGPKKFLGQHFLTAPAFAKKIADAVPADAENVLEIGPGRGALSVYLADRFSKIHFVEVDRDAVDTLKNKLSGSDHVIHNEDVMTFDFARAGFPIHAVGNLPYNIGAVIIKKALLYAPNVLSCTFMVQKEVAARVVSPPRSKDNGWLSIFCQFFGSARVLFHVPPGAFFPKPNVDSSVFQIIVDKDVEKKMERESWAKFFSFVNAGFSMRRKQLAKTLSIKLGGDKEFYANALRDVGMEAMARPEDLDVSVWLGLYNRVCG